MGAMAAAPGTLMGAVAAAPGTLMGAMPAPPDTLMEAVAVAPDTLMEAVTVAPDTLMGAVAVAPHTLMGALAAAPDTVTGAMAAPPGTFVPEGLISGSRSLAPAARNPLLMYYYKVDPNVSSWGVHQGRRVWGGKFRRRPPTNLCASGAQNDRFPTFGPMT